MHSQPKLHISHFGVRGMKWGVRKRSAKEEKERAKRFKKAENRRHISDSELKERTERLLAEKKFKELTDQDLNPGKTIAKKIVSESGQKVARTVITGAALFAVKSFMEKKFDIREAVPYVAPKPKK